MLTVKLNEANNYTGQRAEKLSNTLQLIEKALNSDIFKEKVLHFETDGDATFYFRKNLFGKWIDQPYSNQEVYDLIMTGVELPGNTDANTMDLYLNLVDGSDGDVIGYGNPGNKEIFTYSVMFDRMTTQALANHYTHEWCHKLGFTHSFERERLRNYSVPYGIGNIVEMIADTMLA